jgi:hypothetical protein
MLDIPFLDLLLPPIVVLPERFDSVFVGFNKDFMTKSALCHAKS